MDIQHNVCKNRASFAAEIFSNKVGLFLQEALSSVASTYNRVGVGGKQAWKLYSLADFCALNFNIEKGLYNRLYIALRI